MIVALTLFNYWGGVEWRPRERCYDESGDDGEAVYPEELHAVCVKCGGAEGVFEGWRESGFSWLQFWLKPLKNNCLNVWYVGNSLYLCNTEMNGKRNAPAVHLRRLQPGQSYLNSTKLFKHSQL